MSSVRSPEREVRLVRALAWLPVSAAVIVLDQLTKLLVLRNLTPGERLPVIPGLFDLTLVFNRGAAFSFLSGASGWQRWLFVGIGVAAAAFIVWLLARHAGQRMFALGLALVLGGAIGNLADRLLRGEVVDFLLAWYADHFFPAFNVADSAITVGAVLLVLDELLRARGARR